MYIARQHNKGKTRYILRQSYPSCGHFKSRDLFHLGTDPTRYIIYPGGNSYYVDPTIEETLLNKNVALAPNDLDQVFFEFLDPEIRRVITTFDRGRHNAPHQPEQNELIDQPPPHIFDKRRYHYLRFGHSSQSHIQKVRSKIFRLLQNKSRDELEHYFEAQERRLSPHELGPYVATLFQLSAFRPQPDSHQPLLAQLDQYFMKQLCRINSDPHFLAGAHEHHGLFEHLVKYAIFYFDRSPGHHDAEARYIRDFINRHRIHRPTAKTKIKIQEAEKLFGYDWKSLKNMDNTTLTRIFRRLALKHHPDQGGDPESFRRLSEYYRVLAGKKPKGQDQR